MEYQLRPDLIETMKQVCGKKKERWRSYSTDHWEVIDDLSLGSFEILKDANEQEKEEYNIAVYRVLPYPPYTKDVKDFFIDRQ
jgi:hypothetical protein